MTAVAEGALLTPEDLLALPNNKGFELIDGRLVERNGSVLSSWVGGQVLGRIGRRVDGDRSGWIFAAGNGCQCFPDHPRTVLRPNVTFVRAARLSWDQIDHNWLRVVPDLIAEVISPDDLAYRLDRKIELFHRAGVPLSWVVNPDVRTVRVLRSDGSTALLREGDELSGEDILPSFACPVAALFPPRAAGPGA